MFFLSRVIKPLQQKGAQGRRDSLTWHFCLYTNSRNVVPFSGAAVFHLPQVSNLLFAIFQDFCYFFVFQSNLMEAQRQIPRFSCSYRSCSLQHRRRSSSTLYTCHLTWHHPEALAADRNQRVSWMPLLVPGMVHCLATLRLSWFRVATLQSQLCLRDSLENIS